MSKSNSAYLSDDENSVLVLRQRIVAVQSGLEEGKHSHVRLEGGDIVAVSPAQARSLIAKLQRPASD